MQVKPSAYFSSRAIFTREQFAAAIGEPDGPSRRIEFLLRHHAASAGIVRLRRGLYATVPAGTDPSQVVVDPYALATALQDDAVVAWHAALQYRGRTYSVWTRYHYATGRRARRFRCRSGDFVPVASPRTRVREWDPSRGVVEEVRDGSPVRVATYERTLVDLMASPHLGGGWEEIFRSLEMVEFFDLDAVTDYVLALGSPVVTGRVGFFLEQHRRELFVEGTHLERLQRSAPRQPLYFDPRRLKGKLVKAWNLVVPEQVLERTWAEVP